MILLHYSLTKTTKRLTFDIEFQHESVTFDGEDDGDYFVFTASNGYQVISRSRMDIQSERLWLKGGTNDSIAERSGTMVFPNNEKRDRAYDAFTLAINEWSAFHGGESYQVCADFM